MSNSVWPHGYLPARLLCSWRQEYWRGLLFHSPGDLTDPETEPGSPALQADCLPSEPLRKSHSKLSYLKEKVSLHTNYKSKQYKMVSRSRLFSLLPTICLIPSQVLQVLQERNHFPYSTVFLIYTINYKDLFPFIAQNVVCCIQCFGHYQIVFQMWIYKFALNQQCLRVAIILHWSQQSISPVFWALAGLIMVPSIWAHYPLCSLLQEKTLLQGSQAKGQPQKW